MEYVITGYQKQPCGESYCYIPLINGKPRDLLGTTYLADFTESGVDERVATAISRLK